MAKFQELSERLNHFDLFSDEQDDLATSLFGSAVALSFDETGRITLPDAMAEHANITDKAAFIGLGDKFQIWNPKTAEQRQSAAFSNIKKNKLTLPSKASLDTKGA